MTSIRLKFRHSTKEKEAGTLYYQVIHRRLPRQISTPYRILSAEWDEKKGKVIAGASGERSDHLTALSERIRYDLEMLKRIVLRYEESGEPYTSDTVVEEFGRISTRRSLFTLIQSAIGRHLNNGKKRTAETYVATLHSFKTFNSGEDIMLDTIDSSLMESYEAWLKKRNVTPNTASFYLRILRAVYNRAVEDGVIENKHPFRHVYTGIEKTVKRALPLSMIKKIKELDLSLNRKAQYARDMFILSFMLRGMSLIDMALLKKSDLKDGYLTYRRRKTGQRLSVEWTSEMQRIVDRYPEYHTRYLLPIIRKDTSKDRYAYKNAGEKINRYLKEVAEKVGITIPLSMYVARHSWASIAKTEGIPISVISEGLGHDNETTTRIYLTSLDTTVVDKANLHILNLL